MATIKDVAKMAGVSTTTVSHVINKTRFVAEETEKLVLQAIQDLKYSPSAVARSLKVNTTKSIGNYWGCRIPTMTMMTTPVRDASWCLWL